MNFLYNIIISPIETIVDWVFLFVVNKIDAVGVIGAVLGVSLVINFLALPLYNIADSIQEKERKLAKSMEAGIKRIKKAFKGDEQFMMLQTYYREHNYHPLYTFRSSLSILIEIPFFIAAYHYLSHNTTLQGASWWIFKDLGAPDTFFTLQLGVFSLPVHILPVLMTLINFVSSAIYVKNAPLREKIQLYGIAVVFLALLYNSPSGLVLYWILNNLFSLAKNVVMKTKKPSRFLHIAISAITLLLAAFVLSKHGSIAKKCFITIFAIGIVLLPILVKKLSQFASNKFGTGDFSGLIKPNLPLLLSSGMGLALLLGFMLPARVIATSPVEFSFLGATPSPVSYIFSSFFVFFGFFVFWTLAIYKMFGKKVRCILPLVIFALFLCALANAFIFKAAYGNLSVSFTLEDEKVLKRLSPLFVFLPALVLFASVALFLFLGKRKSSILTGLVASIALAEAVFGFTKIHEINKVFQNHSENVAKYKTNTQDSSDGIEKIYHLSKTEKNVIVLFLDRAISAFFPEIIAQYPELANQFEGFTYYPNTVSFSTNTSLGAPAMMGGYEYTPSAINERSDELLRLKHNESMLVLPKLFTDAGFNAVVSDPPWSNYAHEGDLSPFDPYDNIKAYTTFGKYTSKFFDKIGIKGGVANDKADVICRKEIRNFSVLQALFPAVRSTFYRLCRENNVRDDRTYYNIFSSLFFLSEQTDFTSEKGTYCFIDNDTPHEPHAMNADMLTLSDKKKSLESTHYDSNAASLLQAGKYLDYLRKNGVYDNTRIIIVADHGNTLKLSRFDGFENQKEMARYNPLLLVKDFNASGAIKTDNSFMTNADTLFLAKEGFPVADVNPFTKKTFRQEKENGVLLYPLSNGEHHADHLLKKTQFTLDKSRGYHVQDDITKPENWIPLSVYENEKE